MKKKDLLLIILFVGVIFVAINVSADTSSATCSSIFDENGIMTVINQHIFKPIKLITPILLLILTSIDVAGIVFSGDKKGIDKAKTNFMKRAAAALIIFFAPTLINLIAELVDKQSISSCMGRFGVAK